MRVERIGFTAVKGGRHVRRDAVDLALTGPLGDRVFCLVDLAGDRVLRTAENPDLLRTVSRWQGGALRVELPAGAVEGVPTGTGDVRHLDYWGRTATVEIVDGPWAAAYSRFLGSDVVLGRPVAAGEVVYGASVSIVTTEALRWLSDRVGRPVEAERFRSTFVVDSGPGTGLTEIAWLGREVSVGEARLRVNAVVPRCVVVDLDPRTGERTAPVLKALAGSDEGDRHVEFGIDAVVTQAGRVRYGDAVEVLRGEPAE